MVAGNFATLVEMIAIQVHCGEASPGVGFKSTAREIIIVNVHLLLLRTSLTCSIVPLFDVLPTSYCSLFYSCNNEHFS